MLHMTKNSAAGMYRPRAFADSREIEDYLVRYPEVLGLEKLVRRRSFEFKPDLVGVDEKGFLVVVEVKLYLACYKAVAQAVHYLSQVLKRPETALELYAAELGLDPANFRPELVRAPRRKRRDGGDGLAVRGVRGIVIAPKLAQSAADQAELAPWKIELYKIEKHVPLTDAKYAVGKNGANGPKSPAGRAYRITRFDPGAAERSEMKAAKRRMRRRRRQGQ